MIKDVFKYYGTVSLTTFFFFLRDGKIILPSIIDGNVVNHVEKLYEIQLVKPHPHTMRHNSWVMQFDNPLLFNTLLVILKKSEDQ